MTNKINNIFLWILLFPIVLLCIKAYNNIENYNCERYYNKYCDYDYDYCSQPCYQPCYNDCDYTCENDCDETLEAGKLNVGGNLTVDGNYLDQLPDNFNEINVSGDVELSDNTVQEKGLPPIKCLPPKPRCKPKCKKKCKKKCKQKLQKDHSQQLQKGESQQLQKLQLQKDINYIKQKIKSQQLESQQLQKLDSHLEKSTTPILQEIQLQQTILPGGSWKQTAKNIKIEGDNILIADLQRQNGTYTRDLVIFQPSDSFANENGQFKLI